MSHTPGPLSLEFDGDGALIEGVIRVPNVYQEWREDAQVLAVAPELLAACKSALGTLKAWHSGFGAYAPCEGCHTCQTVIPQLEQAIAKAKGEGR